MPLYHHRFHGQTAGGDIFIFGWHSDSSETSISVMQDAAVSWIDTLMAGATAGAGLQDYLNINTSITRVTTGEIALQSGQQQRVAESDHVVPGVGTANPLPGDVAVVTSLRTDRANRQGRGRFYLPQLSTDTVSADGSLDPAVQSDLLDSLLAAWQGYTVSKTPVVYSRGSATDPTRFTTPVSTFNVGNLYDTQRRRENALTELRSSRTMP